jgi:hypothetical protein
MLPSKKLNPKQDEQKTPPRPTVVPVSKPEETTNFTSVILFTLTVLAFVGVMKLQKNKSDAEEQSVMPVAQPRARINPISEDYRARVNEHLQKLDRDLELRKQLQELQVSKVGTIDETSPSQGQPKPPFEKFDLSQDERPLKVKEDIRTDSVKPDFRRDIDDHISYRLQLKQLDSDYQRIYTREYVKAFIENARKAGYKVRVNDKLEVIVESAPEE